MGETALDDCPDAFLWQTGAYLHTQLQGPGVASGGSLQRWACQPVVSQVTCSRLWEAHRAGDRYSQQYHIILALNIGGTSERHLRRGVLEGPARIRDRSVLLACCSYKQKIV